MSEITVTVKLFGAFRKYGKTLDLLLPAGSSVQDVKNRLAELIDGSDKVLVYESAIANNNEIIGDKVVFTEDSDLAILPPVCGG